LSIYDSYAIPVVPSIRKAGIQAAYKQVVYDDENTSYQGLAPVNKPLNFICRFAEEGPDSEAIKLHREKFRDFLWMGREGLMMWYAHKLCLEYHTRLMKLA